MTKREADFDNARTADVRRLTVDLSGQSDTDWSRIFDQERQVVLNRREIDYFEIILGNQTIQIDMTSGGDLEKAKQVVQEIVDRTNSRVEHERQP